MKLFPARCAAPLLFLLAATLGHRADSQPASVRPLFARETAEKEWQAAFEAAKKSGAPANLLLEAQVLRAIRQNDVSALADFADVAPTLFTVYGPPNSVLFRSESDAKGIIAGLQAAQAWQKNDAPAFESALKAAWWDAPQLGELWGEWASEWKAEQKMAGASIPLDLEIGTHDGKKTTLQTLLKGRKGLLLDFWASWCGPCMSALPELKAKGYKYAPQGILVAGMNTEGSAEIAAKIYREKGIQMPWLVEPAGEPFSKPLEIDSIPRIILVSPSGQILFNGHPNSWRLPLALQKLGVK